VRLINPGNGAALHWPAPAISIVINADGLGRRHRRQPRDALQNAIRAWNEVPGSTRASDREREQRAARAHRLASDDIHLLYFDESNSSGYFPPGSGIVALTPCGSRPAA
jgi:hypothetical protein